MTESFPHPLVARGPESWTPAEKAFFREALRRLKPVIGNRVSLNLTSAKAEGRYEYRLSARWSDGADKSNRATGRGATPGEAMSNLMAALD